VQPIDDELAPVHVLAALAAADEYSSRDAVMARSRFVREPSNADSVETTVNLELLDEMRRARALEEARWLDDDNRRQTQGSVKYLGTFSPAKGRTPTNDSRKDPMKRTAC
jgi:hypothetical protein